MNLKAVKTKLIKPGDDLKKIITESIPSLNEKSVVVITSKIISYAQNRLIDKPAAELDESKQRAAKHEIIRHEADLYLEPNASKYDLMITVKDGIMAVNAGLDESNAVDDKYILWPEKLQETLNELWVYMKDFYQIEELGLIVTDSRTIPLRWGVVGVAVAYCGFKPLYNYIGRDDLFGKKFKMEQLSIVESLASCAVLEMGEGAEQTPLAIAQDIPKMIFQDHPPTKAELYSLKVDLEDDVYEPFLTSVSWKKGKLS